MRSKFLAAVIGLMVAGGAGAATLNVGAGQTYTSIQAAVTDANATVGVADTLLLHDSSYVVGAFIEVTDTLEIVPASGQAVVIDKTSGGGQVFRPNMATGTFTITGASPSSPITLIQNVANAPVINSGGGTVTTNSVVLTNVVLAKPSTGAAAGNTFLNFNNNGQAHALTNVTFTGGDPASTFAVAMFGYSLNAVTAKVALTDVDFSAAAPVGPRIATAGVDLTATDCILTRSAGGVTVFDQQAATTAAPAGTLEIINCTLASGSNVLINATLHTAAYVLTTPTFGAFGGTSLINAGATASTAVVEGEYILTADPLTDTDSDGMTDQWEVAGRLSPTSDTGDDGVAGDPDGDGALNLDEFNAGTNPNDINSAPPPSTTVPAVGYLGLGLLVAALAAIGLRRRAKA